MSLRSPCPTGVCSKDCGYARLTTEERMSAGFISQLKPKDIHRLSISQAINLLIGNNIGLDSKGNFIKTNGAQSFCLCNKTRQELLKKLGKHSGQLKQTRFDLFPASDPDEIPPENIGTTEVLSWDSPDWINPNNAWKGVPDESNIDA